MTRISVQMMGAASTAALIAMAQPALAQTVSTPAESAAQEELDQGGLDDIIVTAQRVEADLQRTPVAVTSVSGEGLKALNITNVIDLGSLAPNVSIGTRTGSGASAGAITIRGIGIDANPPASPSVGIYIDEVYFPASFGNLLGLFDVARIEVLRGPQGTLFGRNTIAGAIQYVSIKPQLGEVSGFGEVTLGNLDRRDFSAGLNLPLGDHVALRVSGTITERDGYVYDRLNDINRGSDETSQFRVQFRVEPASNLTIDLKAEHLDTESNGRATISTGFNYATVFGAPFAPGGLDPFISPDFYTIAGLDGPESAETSFTIAQAVVRYDLSDDISMKSITALSKSESSVRLDNDGSPIPIIHTSRGDITDRLFTQELQLTGNSFGDRLHWTLGGFYYLNRSTSLNNQASIFGMVNDPFGDFRIRTRSIALYGQATFDITDSLSLVGGLRYTEEKIDARNALRPDSGSRSFSDTSPLVGINFQATDDILLYVKASRGFRAGGFSPNAGGYFFFGPEDATTYEGGARMEFLDGHLRVNPTIFRTDWKNIQFNAIAFIPGIPFPFPIINNAGDARLTGAEIELQAAITDQLTLTANAALLDSEYTRIDPSLTGRLTLASDLKRSPKSQINIGFRYEVPVGDDGEITLSANYAWQASQRSATTDLDFIPIPSYGLLNARIEFKPFGSNYSLAIYGTNLTQEEYIVGGTNYGNGGTIPVVAVDVGRPREYGVTLRASF